MIQHEDSDDDECDGYFLRPVNEYNIIEKIKLANQELFNSEESGKFSKSTIRTSSTTNSGNRVRFRNNLVDYEPEYSDYDENDSSYLQCTENLENNLLLNNLLMMDDDEDDDDKSQECVSDLEIDQNQSNAEVDEIKKQINVCLDNTLMDRSINSPTSSDIDEICEEIIGMDLNSNEKTEIQITLNENDDYNKINTKNDSSFYNLSEYFDIFLLGSETYNYKNNKDHDRLKQNNEKKSLNKNFFKKSTSTQSNFTKKSIQSSKLGLRMCCEPKFFDYLYLPIYNGYYSEYGLSKTELELREKHLKRYKEKRLKIIKKLNEEKLIKSEKSENAFSSWLKNKMKNPKNKTKNMFDVNRKNKGKTKKIQN